MHILCAKYISCVLRDVSIRLSNNRFLTNCIIQVPAPKIANLLSQGHIASTHEEVQGGSKMATLWRMHHFSLQVNNCIILFITNHYLWLLMLS